MPGTDLELVAKLARLLLEKQNEIERLEEKLKKIHNISEDTPTEEPTKYCYRCTKTKPKTDFHKNKARYDGLNNLCKSCKVKLQRARRAKKRS